MERGSEQAIEKDIEEIQQPDSSSEGTDVKIHMLVPRKIDAADISEHDNTDDDDEMLPRDLSLESFLIPDDATDETKLNKSFDLFPRDGDLEEEDEGRESEASPTSSSSSCKFEFDLNEEISVEVVWSTAASFDSDIMIKIEQPEAWPYIDLNVAYSSVGSEVDRTTASKFIDFLGLSSVSSGSGSASSRFDLNYPICESSLALDGQSQLPWASVDSGCGQPTTTRTTIAKPRVDLANTGWTDEGQTWGFFGVDRAVNTEQQALKSENSGELDLNMHL